MTPIDYLEAVLSDQELTEDEFEALRERRDEIKNLLQSSFSDESPSIRDAGSYAKKTMIRESYDYDLLCYFDSDTGVGDTLKEIYDAVDEALSEEYLTERKRSALKILNPTEDEDPEYFHVDAVPGRFVDGSDGDVFLHQEGGDKERLKTNPEEQISHVRDSGVRSAIKLMKLWRERRALTVATFVLELLVIDLLEGREDESLPDQLLHVWNELSERGEDLTVEDPANSSNDLGDLFDDGTKAALSRAAGTTLDRIEEIGWESVFGEVEEEKKEEKAAKVASAASAVDDPHRPWFSD